MQLIKPFALSLSSRCFEFRKRRRLSVTAMVYFPFSGAGPPTVWTEMGMWKFLGKEMPLPIIDEGMIKLKPEYIVHGYGCAPGGSAEACAVRARVGGLEKTLLVFGNRYWDGNYATAPQPFSRVPLDWQHAYGGPDFPANPLGRGRVVQDANGVKAQRLPNIESPQQRLTGPKASAQPAGFGMIDLMWPQRAQFRGTYDDKWSEEHAPGMAPDTNWNFFNFAPEDQIFDQALRGDEAFEFENLHPGKSLVGGRLPGVRTRVYCNRRLPGGGEKLSEVQMQITTLWFFPHAERGVMISHGQLEITEPDGTDVLLMLGALERIEEPKGDEHYLQVLAQRQDPKSGYLYALRDSDLLPSGLSGSDPEFEETKSDYKLDGLMGETQLRRAELQVGLLREKVKQLGHDPDALGIKMPVSEKIPTIEELPAYVEKKSEEALIAQRDSLFHAAQQIVAAETAAAKAGIDLRKAEHRGPPTFSASAKIAQIRAAITQSGTPPDLDLAKLEPKFKQVEVVERFNYVMGAHMQAPALPLPAPTANLLRRQAVQAKAAGMTYIGGDFTGADFSGLDLSHADFTHASLESVNFTGAKLDGANFSYAVLAHANLTDASALGAIFTNANLGKAKLAGAVFDQARLTNAILFGVDFTETAFRGADLNGTQQFEATYGVSDWSNAHCPSALFIKTKLVGMIFAGANLKGANFVECDLTGVDFRNANLAGANFVACKAPQASFAGAALPKAVFVQTCALDGADFTGANLESANLRGAKLKQAVFAGASLVNVDLSEAELQGADFTHANLAESMVVKSNLDGATATGSNWMNAIAQRSDIRGVDFSGASLFAADVSLVDVDSSTRFTRCYTVRIKTYPRRVVAPEPES